MSTNFKNCGDDLGSEDATIGNSKMANQNPKKKGKQTKLVSVKQKVYPKTLFNDTFFKSFLCI